MSAICGYISFGRQPDREDLRPVQERLAFRGPDGFAVWAGERVLLGYAALATTPEAEVEVQPWAHRASGCVITADARLDNREDVAAALSIDLRERTIGDAELILRAWQRWGEECPRRLLGDFAFAIWDPAAQRLFCARDQMGMRQLIWGRRDPKSFIFATDARAVHAAAPERFPVNEDRIADFMENLEGIDREVTFFRGVSRLPPAHRLSFDERGLRIDRYWTLEAPVLRTGLADAEHEEGFREIFRQAVGARLRSNRPVASMLSGGMDSTSVCAIAAEILAAEGRGPLVTVSAVGPDPETCQETRGAHAAWTMPGLEPHSVDHTRLHDLLPALVEQFRDMGEPFDWYMNLSRAVYLRAAGLGARVVLDGGAGDIVFKPGDLQARLLRRGRIAAAWRDIRDERAFLLGGGHSVAFRLAEAVWRAFMPEPVKLLRHRLATRLDRKPGEGPLAGRVNMAQRRYRARMASRHGDPRLGAILHPILTAGRERYDRVAAQSGVEPRDPFMDLRVIEYLLRVPPELMRVGGWPKTLLRRAMSGRVPDAVRWRRGTFHLGPLFTEQVLSGMNDAVVPAWLLPLPSDAAEVCRSERSLKRGLVKALWPDIALSDGKNR